MIELETEASQQKIKSFLENNDCFSIANYHVIKKKIGMGSFATIYHGIEKDIAKDVAIKRIHVKDIKKIAQNVKKEIEIMKDLSHPNIIRMYDVIYENDFDNVNIVMEYAPLGNLYDYLKKQGTIDEIYSKYYLRQVAKGLKYLLSKNIIHRDLKPHNILLFEHDLVKLADFGLARSFQEDQYFNTLCGSPLYMAPEIVLPLTNKDSKLKKSEKIYTIKADLWSIGIILYEMVTGKYPITPKTLNHLPKQLNELEIKIPDTITISKECNDLISKLLVKDQMKRIEWNDFFMHQWFSINEIKEEKKKMIDNENKILEYAENCINDNDNNFSLYKFSPLSPLNQLSFKNHNNNFNSNNTHSKNTAKLDKLNFDLVTPKSQILHKSGTNDLDELHNSFQEIKKSCYNNSLNIKNNTSNHFNTSYQPSSLPNIRLNNPNQHQNKVKVEPNDDINEELFMSCEDKDDNKIENNKMNSKNELEQKLDLILLEINELKNNQSKLLKTQNNENINELNNKYKNIKNEKWRNIEEYEDGYENGYDLDLSFNKIMESDIEIDYNIDNIIDINDTNDNLIPHQLSFEKIKNSNVTQVSKYNHMNENEKYVMIQSNPIDIKKINSTVEKQSTPIKDSLKYYINNSINIIKESANYLSGNYKSI